MQLPQNYEIINAKTQTEYPKHEGTYLIYDSYWLIEVVDPMLQTKRIDAKMIP